MSGESKNAEPVWSKRVGSLSAAQANIDFCAGYDVRGREAADHRLAPFDLMTNAAHLTMLSKQHIVGMQKAASIAKALQTLKFRHESGEDLLRPACEDIHMSIEAAVTEIAGEGAGGRLHTGRSRNDQVATDMKLWLRQEAVNRAEAIVGLANCILEHAAKHLETVCPGFTHGQPAMITTWGHWTMSYTPRCLRILKQLRGLLAELTTCPLGAAASFGTSWPIDREMTAKLLGFRHPTPSGADGIWSRGELEARYSFTMAQFLNHLSGIAQDIILLSSPPRTWLQLADEHVTGSSIMPQKRNPDFAEVTRSRAAVAAGIVQGFLGVGKDMPSGYNRDSQWTKYLAFDAADNAAGAAEIFTTVFQQTIVDRDAMLQACNVGFMNATDVADYLSRTRDLPFRTTYKVMGEAVRRCTSGMLEMEELNTTLRENEIAPLKESEWANLSNSEKVLKQRNQTGNPAPQATKASIEILREEIAEEAEYFQEQIKHLNHTEKLLWEELNSLVK